MILRAMFSRRWLPATILVIAGALVTARLGLWQLDRLAERREFNSRVSAQQAQPPLDLNAAPAGEDTPAMEYRQVNARGEYIHSQQVGLRNQVYRNRIGVHLLTPLRLEGSGRVVLVERGWVPDGDFRSGNLAQYDEPGVVNVTGIIRLPQSSADFGSRSDPTLAPGETRLNLWNFVNVERIAAQSGLDLLPVYLLQNPEPGREALPARTAIDLDLSEGPHQSYALQWFSFSALLLVGYPVFIYRQMRSGRKAG
jgi:surfeit locus 1 family protein